MRVWVCVCSVITMYRGSMESDGALDAVLQRPRVARDIRMNMIFVESSEIQVKVELQRFS